MTVRQVFPAPISAVLELIEHDPFSPSLTKFGGRPLSIVLRHLGAGPSCLFCDQDGPLVAAGLVPIGDGLFEAWFLTGGSASMRMLQILRKAQLTLQSFAEDGPVRIRARVAPGWCPGERLARILGMNFAGREFGMDLWEKRIERRHWGPYRAEQSDQGPAGAD